MKKIAFAALVLFGVLSAGLAEAKDKDDYLFLITISRSTGEQELIYTDLYVLSGTATASNVTVGGRTPGSGEDVCDRHMKVAVKGTDGLSVSRSGVAPLLGMHRSWDIAWNDKLTVQSQKFRKSFSVTMQDCPFPLFRMVSDE